APRLSVHRRAADARLRPGALRPPMRLVIVGGGPAALAAARGYRAAGGDGDVTMITRELVPPYPRPALSKEYLRGEVDEASLALEPPEWYAQHGVEVRLGATMSAL